MSDDPCRSAQQHDAACRRAGHPPRVGLVSTRSFPDVGGIESHVDALTARLDATVWDVDLVATDNTGRLPRRDRLHGVPVRRYRSFPRRRDWYLSPGVFLDVLCGRRDLVHIHGVNALVPPIAMLAAILRRVPFVVTLHSGGAHSDLRRRMRSTQWRLVALLLRRASAVIAVSSSESKTFTPLVGRGPIPVIPNGSLDLPAPRDVAVDPDLVLSVGRLERYKGHHLVIEALPHLLSRRPGARVRILGTGPYEAELHSLARRLGVDDHVVITSVPPEDRAAMARELSAAAVVALMSDYEAHPVVVMESLSLGRPVVARRNSGFVEMIDGGLVSGVPDDARSSTIAAALDEARVRGPRQAVDLPTWDGCVDAVEATYRRVLAGRA